MNCFDAIEALQKIDGHDEEYEKTRVEIKKQLYSYRDLKAEHAQILEELERVETLMSSPRAPKMDGMPFSSGNDGSPVELLAIKHMSLQDLYRKRVEMLLAEQMRVEEMINSLEPTERRLARFRYIDGLTWEEVCTCMNYSWRQTHRIHGRIIDKLVDAELKKRNTPE